MTPKRKPNVPSPMQTGSSASVQVFWLNRPETLNRLQSDVDLLLILRESPIPLREKRIGSILTATFRGGGQYG